MNSYAVGLLLLARPFEVWLASYMLLQVIERKEIVGWVNYILLGMNAFATLVAIYGMVVGRSDGTLGNIFGKGLGAVLIASAVVIWVLWLFTGIYYSMSNNRRGITISLSNMKKVDRIMLYFVVPASMLICMIEMMTLLTSKDNSVLNSVGAVLTLLGCLVVVGLNIWYLIALKSRLYNYIVFGKKEIEVWKGQRQRIYRYTSITEVEQLEIKSFFNCKYKLIFSKDGAEETVILNDERIEKVLAELLKFNNRSNKRNGGNI